MHTLIGECRSGIPENVVSAAKAEGIDAEKLARSVLGGRAVIPANRIRSHKLCAIGEGCGVRVNVNIGTSGARCDPDLEMKKAQCALDEGADAIMDLSTGGDLPAIRKEVLKLDTTVGTVPIYEAVRRAGNALDVTGDLLFNVIREHCRQGVDFLTLHCGVNLDTLKALKDDPRTMGVVSRGGAFHTAIMAANGEENPLYSEYDYLMEILSEYDVVVSLGDGMRPGAMVDAVKRAKTVEYLNLGELSKRALDAGVMRMIEGPGHIPVDQIAYNVKMIKELSGYAPLYLLGPLVTDIAPGYDHVSGAIGGAIAALNGADFLCMVSPSEHLALPDIEDIREGTRVARIAAHVGSIKRLGDRWFETGEADMAEARRNLDWKRQFSLAMFGEHAKRIHDRDGDLETCSMCGDLCAVKLVRDCLGNLKMEDKKKIKKQQN
ncbi:phosphomethylpyrimidine synthase [Methanomicrobium sp. W14]|uniref:phosphomethylpyrimidine synthase ThiC n=1 Tax=Methanomicrobium sp. W14 TaxID=2817839 RepID=UPI001AE701D9|nr:phosphomethylpyrimidine synthase ThiC [Methanomicrobium sp. W14]MBP2133508.1 phosphomethylpyrimidine synthase [Methanomicrobium sp. W14]